eukprot:GFYU01009817.1.p2 GENE.GFYU01009817.1~~GFYU01009817.1.p2  ORF type:complete len:191 (+),score=50.14 GFYU01009817.1:52-624(+)
MVEYLFGHDAYCKAVLHCSKYPSNAVCGVLVGQKQGEKVVLTDAMPLNHMPVLTPMLEVAFAQIEAHLSDKGNKSEVVGLYWANEHINDSSLSGIAKKIGDKIKTHFSHACIVVMDNDKMKDLEKTMPVNVYVSEKEGAWKVWDKIEAEFPVNLELAVRYLTEGRQFKLVDFEDHLENIAGDWRNGDLFQ